MWSDFNSEFCPVCSNYFTDCQCLSFDYASMPGVVDAVCPGLPSPAAVDGSVCPGKSGLDGCKGGV
jgi:hypothetical protein